MVKVLEYLARSNFACFIVFVSLGFAIGGAWRSMDWYLFGPTVLLAAMAGFVVNLIRAKDYRDRH